MLSAREKGAVACRLRSSRDMAYPSLRAQAKQSRNLTEEAAWVASAYARGRFGGLQARHSSSSERRRAVACTPRKDRTRSFAFSRHDLPEVCFSRDPSKREV